ncbi:hypothetical protein ABFB09_01395 [Dehalogenimonas sp. THU2]|jgi:hypothetical protein
MTKKATVEKKPVDLKTFIENVNKKDEVSGHKIHFAFCNRKRKGG